MRDDRRSKWATKSIKSVETQIKQLVGFVGNLQPTCFRLPKLERMSLSVDSE